MKKIGLIASISFIAGALFFALTFGYLQKPEADFGPNTGIAAGGPVMGPAVAHAETAPGAGNGLSFAPLVKKVRPAVVKVMAETLVARHDLLDRFFNLRPRQERVPGVGSGFFISGDGYMITNNHVVKDALKVVIKTIDGEEYNARIIGTDPKTDLALLKTDLKDIPFIELGDSNKVQVGEWVLAIGNPLEQDLSVTAGIISAKGRQLGLAAYEDFLQTDAAINKGNSGGPLINMEGKVIGINSVILAPSGGNIGIGFAIPSNMAKKVVQDLKTKGRVVRGYLGITPRMLSENEAKQYDFPTGGAVIVSVERNSPAEKAGLKKYDLIVEAGGKRIKSSADLAIKIAEVNPGDILELTIYRGDKKKTVKVRVDEAPDTVKYRTQGENSRNIDLGMVLVDNSPQLAREHKLKTSQGILVKQVERGSPADYSEISERDVILEVNRKEVDTVEQFMRIIAGKKPGSSLLLYVNRFGEEGFIEFKLPR